MELGKRVVDKELLDATGRRAGKVDDLILDVPELPGMPGMPGPEVVAILTGPMALSQSLPRWCRWWQWMARHLYRLAGVTDARPVEVPWRAVQQIDVVVRANFDRRLVGATAAAEALERRVVARLPGA